MKWLRNSRYDMTTPLAGALKHAVLMSLIVTCEQQNRRFLDLALSLWRERNPGAISIQSLPDVG